MNIAWVCAVLSLSLLSLTTTSALNEFKHISEYNNKHANLTKHNKLSTESNIVYTDKGYIEGTLTTTTRVFRKIPFAKPPVNSTGRWHAPVEADSWGPDYVLQAVGDPPACLQAYCGQWEACGRAQTQVYSEDCLYLNVNTPINMTNSSSLLPVMFFIHGGNYEWGYGGGYLYNGSDITNLTNVITVTINYRLGVMGFYWNEKYGFEGNYGILDQIMALKWVQTNIEYFGGDPNQVTVFGQSAGAMSAAVLGMIEEAQDLFKDVIWQSEPLGIPMRNPTTWEDLPQIFIDYADCTHIDSQQKTLDCLYSLDATQLIDAQMKTQTSIDQFTKLMDVFVPWTPTVGTGLISTQPYWYYSNNSQAMEKITQIDGGNSRTIGNSDGKPLLAGVVHDEAALFVYQAFPEPMPYDELIGLYHIILKTESNIKKIQNQYPIPTNVTDYRPYASIVVTDGLFHCPNRNVTATLSLANVESNKDNIFFYHFEHIPSFSAVIWDPINQTECLTRVCHGDDLPFVFRPNVGPVNATMTNSEYDLAYAMQFYWSQFAKSQSPGNGNTKKYNNGTEIEWTNFNNETQNTLIFRTGAIQMIENYDKEKCIVWDEVSYPWLPHP